LNVLDENLRQSPRKQLIGWRIQVRQIGVELGRSGMHDDEIISLLHASRRVTFFTRDLDFYKPELRHKSYCLVCPDVPRRDAAEYVRRTLKHRSFNTIAKRLGTVVRVSAAGLHVWRMNAQAEDHMSWPD
jgi:hypothetical protein